MWTASSARELCLNLLQADYESEVVDLLTKAGLWNDQSAWRNLGDQSENYSTIGNQQSRAESAFIEKLINSIDTKLIAACRMAGINPEGSSAPKTMAEAKELFFGSVPQETLARSISVAATGARAPGDMSLSISDDGEGQTPRSMPRTILSVLGGSKKNIRFVQGRFHMGGTGVLEFCGIEHNVQFVLSRRNPKLLPPGEADPLETDWSFTIIRRENPEPGSPRGSRFTFLAPGEPGQDGKNTLLHFPAESLLILPEKDQAYARAATHGTIFKLYEYKVRTKSNVILPDGFMGRVRLLLPEPALPMRFHECRGGFRGKSASFDTSMIGVVNTLDNHRNNEKSKVVEYYDKFVFDVDGEPFTGRIYLLENAETAKTYRKDEGIIFTFNGQAHATMSKDFFRRGSVKQDYLWNSLLVFVDCTHISVRAHEVLFMPSRDRLRDSELKRKLEQALEDKLKNHTKLRQIAIDRREKEIAKGSATEDSLQKFFEDMLRKYPHLAALLGPGLKIKNPFKPMEVLPTTIALDLHRFPTYFRFRKVSDDGVYRREANLNSQVRLSFDTDAEDDYFSRDDEPGEFSLRIDVDGELVPAKNWKSPTLSEGQAHVSLALPPDATVDSVVRFVAEVSDPSRIDPFVMPFELTVKPERIVPPGPTPSPSPLPKPSSKPGHGQSTATTLAIPIPIEVPQDKWSEHEDFDKFTAVVIKARPDAPEGQAIYDYYVNTSNLHLLAAIKAQPKHQHLMKRQFVFGLTILALSLVQEDMLRPAKTDENGGDDSPRPPALADQVRLMTSAMAPFMIPMISMLAVDDEPAVEPLSDVAGEAA